MANIKYCQKNKDYVEHGESPIRGQAGGLATKRKWDEIKSNAKAGDFDKIEDEVFVKHYHNLKRIRQDYITAPPDLESPCGLWIWGEPRVGKSYKVRKDYPDYYDKPCNKWWDGYQGEPYILIDDFDRNHVCLGHHIKRWSDRYAFPAEQKGTTIQIRPKKIIVTSNYSPEQIWEDTTLCKAIESRFEIIYLEKQY